jgi:undecaprenyl-diphosphatase
VFHQIISRFKTADVAVLRFLRTHGHWPPLERVVVRYSRLGEHSAIWFAVAALGWLVNRPRRPAYSRLARTLAAVEVINAFLKILIGRRRPRLAGLPALASTRSQRSCPSAHASSSFAAARVLSGPLPTVPVYATAVAMALSRPYLGVHYPSDIAAGMVLGTLIADSVSAPPAPDPGTSGRADKKHGNCNFW